MQIIQYKYENGDALKAVTIENSRIKFFHNDKVVAEIDEDGNLKAKNLIENTELNKLVLVENPTIPHCYYNGNKMTCLWQPDLSGRGNFPAIMWDDSNFYCWGIIDKQTDSEKNKVQFKISEDETGYRYYRFVLRGNFVKYE